MKWSDPSAFQLSYYRSPGFKHKKLDRYAAQASRLHPLVGDWICAAPILATMLADQRHYQGLYDLACSRGRLVDALRVCHVPTPMRKQAVAEVDGWHSRVSWRSTFPEMPESELAQMLVAMPGKNDRDEWTRKIAWAMKRRPAGTDFGDFARWAVRTSAKHTLADIANIIHFMRENEFDLKWTFKQFQRAHHAWVERQRAEWEIEREARREADAARYRVRAARAEKVLDEVIPYAPFPVSTEIMGVRITALDTPRKLLDEGYAMRHCVGGEQFRSAMRKRTALYFHLDKEERSTLEIQRRGERFLIGQHCGPCNQRPSAGFQHVASLLLSSICTPGDGPAQVNATEKSTHE